MAVRKLKSIAVVFCTSVAGLQLESEELGPQRFGGVRTNPFSSAQASCPRKQGNSALNFSSLKVLYIAMAQVFPFEFKLILFFVTESSYAKKKIALVSAFE